MKPRTLLLIAGIALTIYWIWSKTRSASRAVVGGEPGNVPGLSSGGPASPVFFDPGIGELGPPVEAEPAINPETLWSGIVEDSGTNVPTAPTPLGPRRPLQFINPAQ